MRRALLALLLGAGLGLLVVVPAGAVGVTGPQSGPPDSDGRSAYCDVGMSSVTYGAAAGNVEVSVACQYGQTAQTLAGVTWQVFGSPNCSALSFPAATTGAYTVSQNGSGRYRASYFGPIGPSGTFTATSAWVSRIVVERGTNDESVGMGYSYSGNACDPATLIPAAIASTWDTSTAVMPALYWSGSAPGSSSSTEWVEPGDLEGVDNVEDCGPWYRVACHFRNALRAAFVPDPDFWDQAIEDVQGGVEQSFPLNVAGDLVDGVSWFRGEVSDAMSNAGCRLNLLGPGGIDFTKDGNSDFSVSLPTGECSYSDPVDQFLTDLGGKREIIRNLARFALWFVFLYRVVRAFAPGGSSPIGPGEPS
jgi:hypothetical protein